MGVRVANVIRWDTCSTEVLAAAADTRLSMRAQVLYEGVTKYIDQPVRRGVSFDDVVGQAREIAHRCAQGGRVVTFNTDPTPYTLVGYDVLVDGQVVHRIVLDVQDQENDEDEQ
jgi:hypothetical protein